MTTEHPITPPTELIREWTQYHGLQEVEAFWRTIATQAARWGADQELEACCEWSYHHLDRGPEWSMDLRLARRPKPPSLKDEVGKIIKWLIEGNSVNNEDAATLRRALESLPD